MFHPGFYSSLVMGLVVHQKETVAGVLAARAVTHEGGEVCKVQDLRSQQREFRF